MLSGTKFIARLAVFRRLTGRLMQHDAIYSPAEGVVGVGFQFGRAERPMGAIAFHLRERFGFGLALPIDMRSRGGLFKIKFQPRIRIKVIRCIVVHPKLAGGKIAAPQVLQCVFGGILFGPAASLPMTILF